MIVKQLIGKKENSNLLFLTYLIYIKNNNKTNKKNGNCVGVYCIAFHCVAFHCVALALYCIALAFLLCYVALYLLLHCTCFSRLWVTQNRMGTGYAFLLAVYKSVFILSTLSVISDMIQLSKQKLFKGLRKIVK